jgi:hypothetical protein
MIRRYLAVLLLLASPAARAQFSFPPSAGFSGKLSSGQFLAPSGILTAPGYAFAAQPAMGMFRGAAGDLRLTAEGTNYISLTASGATILLALNNVGNSTSGTIGSDGNGLLITSSSNLITPGSDGSVSLGVGGARFNNGNFAGTVTGGTFVATTYKTTNLLCSATAPTISSGFGSTPSISANNGTCSFRVNVGTGGAASTGVIGLTGATTGWNCWCNDLTTLSTGNTTCKQTASTTTTATIEEVSDVAVVTAWASGDILSVTCFGF